MTRPTWDEYFTAGAQWVATRGDCTRRQVGALIVDGENRIVSTGYNGTEPGGPSCLAGECPRGRFTHDQVPADSPYTDCVASHAECNAIVWAGREKCKGATLYVTHEPCHECARLIRAAGIGRVVVSGE